MLGIDFKLNLKTKEHAGKIGFDIRRFITIFHVCYEYFGTPI